MFLMVFLGRKFRRSTNLYLQGEDGLIRLGYEDGLHIILPKTPMGSALEELRIAHPALQSMPKNLPPGVFTFVHPNPPVEYTYPWSRQPIGHVIDHYLARK